MGGGTHHCQVNRSVSLLVGHLNIGSVQDEQRAQLSAALLSCLVQRSEVPSVCGIHQAVVLDEHGCYVHMLGGEREREGGGGKQDKSFNEVISPHQN